MARATLGAARATAFWRSAVPYGGILKVWNYMVASVWLLNVLLG